MNIASEVVRAFEIPEDLCTASANNCESENAEYARSVAMPTLAATSAAPAGLELPDDLIPYPNRPERY